MNLYQRLERLVGLLALHAFIWLDGRRPHPASPGGCGHPECRLSR